MNNIVETAKKNKDLKTLVRAIQKADLAGTLSGKGPFTVFAPNEAAFKGLPPGRLDKILEDKQELQKILKHHVVKGKVKASEIASGAHLETLQGTRVRTEKDGGLHFGKANIVKNDIECSNGVCHVIDTVLTP